MIQLWVFTSLLGFFAGVIRSRGVPKSIQNRSREFLGAEPGSKGVLEASWHRFLDPVGTQNGPQRGLESKLKFEAILDPPRGTNRGGPAARGRPQWEGTFGESTYGRRWASPKLCLSQCFRDLQSLRSTAPSEPEGSVAGSPVGLRPQTGH